MAMHAGLGLSRIIVIFGAGYTGTVLFKHGKLSDLIGELQKLVKGLESSEDSANSDPDALTAEVLRLAHQVRQLASYNPQVTVLNGGSSQTGISALIIPVGVLGTLGYGYMWWKGLSFSDLMWVSKRSMANAVSNLTKHLESVSDALAKAKRHLTQRIENLDGKVDDVKETTKLIKNDVSNARVDLSRIGGDLSDLKNTVYILDGRIDLLEDKQNLTLAGVDWLCQIVDGKRVPTYQQFLQMIVDEMNILSTVMLKADKEKVYCPNSVLTTKPISNFYRSPDNRGDTLEFSIDFMTPIAKIGMLEDRIKIFCFHLQWTRLYGFGTCPTRAICKPFHTVIMSCEEDAKGANFNTEELNANEMKSPENEELRIAETKPLTLQNGKITLPDWASDVTSVLWIAVRDTSDRICRVASQRWSIVERLMTMALKLDFGISHNQTFDSTLAIHFTDPFNVSTRAIDTCSGTFLYQITLHSQVKAILSIEDAWFDLQDGFLHTDQNNGRPTSSFFPLTVAASSTAGMLFTICVGVTKSDGVVTEQKQESILNVRYRIAGNINSGAHTPISLNGSSFGEMKKDLIFRISFPLLKPLSDPCLAVGFLPLPYNGLRVGQLVTVNWRIERRAIKSL